MLPNQGIERLNYADCDILKVVLIAKGGF